MNGFQNEIQIIETINTVAFNNLSSDFKNALIKINNGNIPKSLSAEKIGGRAKPDLSIKLDSNVYYISVKKGSGNSVHQEKLATFIPFVKTLDASVELINAIKLFIWSDGTIDGSGKIIDRKNAKEMAHAYPSEIKMIQRFFNTHKEILIHRFITTGIYNTSDKVTHLIYGDINNIFVAPIEHIELFLSSQDSTASVSVGKLSFQAWNVVKNGNPNTENRRGQIQLKWGGLKQDIKEI